MYYLYVLKSLKTGRYYIGQTELLAERLTRHNNGHVPSTRNGAPWKLILREEYATRSEACRREQEVKGYKGGIKFKKLVGLWNE